MITMSAQIPRVRVSWASSKRMPRPLSRGPSRARGRPAGWQPSRVDSRTAPTATSSTAVPSSRARVSRSLTGRPVTRRSGRPDRPRSATSISLSRLVAPDRTVSSAGRSRSALASARSTASVARPSTGARSRDHQGRPVRPVVPPADRRTRGRRLHPDRDGGQPGWRPIAIAPFCPAGAGPPADPGPGLRPGAPRPPARCPARTGCTG